jgi:hypothetical protein
MSEAAITKFNYGEIRARYRLLGLGSSAVTSSWLLSMSANSFAVSAEMPIAGTSSTTATLRLFVSQTIQPFVTFLTLYLIVRKALVDRRVPKRSPRRDRRDLSRDLAMFEHRPVFPNP